MVLWKVLMSDKVERFLWRLMWAVFVLVLVIQVGAYLNWWQL